jgi:hypothetical protein
LGSSAETWAALEAVDNAWNIGNDWGNWEGYKCLHIPLTDPRDTRDRYIPIKNSEMRIVDTVGHYLFEIELYDTYGNPYDYELMENLELRFAGQGE